MSTTYRLPVTFVQHALLVKSRLGLHATLFYTRKLYPGYDPAKGDAIDCGIVEGIKYQHFIVEHQVDAPKMDSLGENVVEVRILPTGSHEELYRKASCGQLYGFISTAWLSIHTSNNIQDGRGGCFSLDGIHCYVPYQILTEQLASTLAGREF